MSGPAVDSGERGELAELVRELAVVRGRVVLSSGGAADYYVDLRRVTLHHHAAPLIGRLLRGLTADWDFDTVATAMLHASGRPLDAFVVRKSVKEHGLQQRIEGPGVAGRRVLAVEDTSTTGGSVLTAVEALREAGATVVGVAVIVDRETEARGAIEDAGLTFRALLQRADLGV